MGDKDVDAVFSLLRENNDELRRIREKLHELTTLQAEHNEVKNSLQRIEKAQTDFEKDTSMRLTSLEQKQPMLEVVKQGFLGVVRLAMLAVVGALLLIAFQRLGNSHDQSNIPTLPGKP